MIPLIRATARPARPDEGRDPGQASHLVPPRNFKPARAAQPFLHPDLRRDERGWVRACLLALTLLIAPVAHAQDDFAQKPAATLSPEVEQTAREVGKSLRCVVCQNQSIEESNAPLAEDMRRLVRERLAAGDTKDQVMTFMTDRYGNFVRLQPPMQIDTLFLWFGPAIFLVIAVWAWLAYLRPQAKRSHAPAPLTDAEAAALNQRISESQQS